MFGLDEQSALLRETLPDTEYFKVMYDSSDPLYLMTKGSIEHFFSLLESLILLTNCPTHRYTFSIKTGLYFETALEAENC
jgi:hypothetical protein